MSRDNDNLYIVIPAYNEEENIREVVDEWIKIVEKIGNNSKLVVINDGSKDSTLKILKKCKKKYSDLVVLDKENTGHGPTLFYGYQYALSNNASYIFQTDSDGQTTSTEFFKFWDNRKNYDAIIGNRNKRKDGLSRIVVTKILKFLLFIVFKVNVKDANCPYRLIKSECLKKNVALLEEDCNLTNVLLSVLFVKNEKVLFLPITFKKREKGKNSINLVKIIKIGFKETINFYKMKKIWRNHDKKKSSN